jgi:hypothetical protein
MAPLPLIKIGMVLFKEISKPIAAAMKRQAMEHPHLRRFATWLGRGWEGGKYRIERWAFFSGGRPAGSSSGARPTAKAVGGGGDASAPSPSPPVPPITEQQALTVGADLLAQGFLLSTAIGLVVLEYWRSASIKAVEDREKEKKKQERRAAKEARMRAVEEELFEVRSALSRTQKELLETTARVLVEKGGGGEGDAESGRGRRGGGGGGGEGPPPPREASRWWPLLR